MPDLTPDEKVVAVGRLVTFFEKLAEAGRKPGLGSYAERRLPALREALERHKAAAS